MNMLSLRVSSIKGSENLKKNSDLRIELLKLSEKNEKLFAGKNDSFIHSFNNCDSIENQIKLVRQISTVPENAFKIKFLCNLYFETALKHPIRQTTVKILQNWNSDEVVKHLVETIITCISDAEGVTYLPQLNGIVNSLSGCLENFRSGCQAVCLSITQIMPFLDTTISKYLNELKKPISPATKNEFSLFLHSSVRLYQSCLQQFQPIPSSIDKFYEIIENEDTPMDTKVNCGTIIALHSKQQKMFSDFILKCENYQSDFNLCLIAGYINTLEKIDVEIAPNSMITIGKNLCSHGERNTNDSAIILAVSRAIFQITKRLLSFDWTFDETHNNNIVVNLNKCSEIFLDFTLINLEHNLDSVRHLCRDILKNLTSFTIKYEKQFTSIVRRIYDCSINDSTTIVQCNCLISLGCVVGVEKILQRSPNIVRTLASKLDHLTVSSSFENLMLKNFEEIDFELWYSRWMGTLIEEMIKWRAGDEHFEAVGNLIKRSVKKDPSIIFKINQETVFASQIGLRLACLGTARKKGFFDNFQSCDDFWKGILSYNELEDYILLEDDEIVIASLRLLAEAHRTTEPFESRDFVVILRFLETNINCQSPSMRQQILAYLKIIFFRLKSVIPVLIRNKNEVELKVHLDFLINIFDFALENIYSGANFSRRTISAKILIQIIPTLNEHSTRLDLVIWTDEKIEKLLKGLDDSYETNKALIIEVLDMIDYHRLTTSTLITIDSIYALASSVRPNDSITAAYHLEFMCRIKKDLKQLNIISNNEVPTKSKEIYLGVKWCLNSINSGLKVAKISLLRASRENPLYGFVFCIRHLMDKLNWFDLIPCSIWRQIIENIIIICKELTTVVGPIVNNSSPEGHFPNDFTNVEHLDKNLYESETNDDAIKSITPQMILLCAWRTVKEVSLLLGDISLRSPISRITTDSGCGDDGCICIKQILEIGEHFTELLSETKHRGAFEQAYVGFSQLCQRLWSSSIDVLHRLPFAWLENLMEIISEEKDNEKLCATRRSAGIPFMVQALITSELQVCSSRGLQFCMRRLLDLVTSGKTPETRTHSLNILRALFRCSDLSECVAEFVSDGLESAIRGYDALTWSEQNSSTLLFSALMVRIFGVQRTRDNENLNIRNKMTGRIFFLRYPKLYDFFLNELKRASQVIKTGYKFKRLHPILLLLSRLYPSSLEGTESNLKLAELLPFIVECSSCSEMTTRILLAKSIVVLIQSDQIFNRIGVTIVQIRKHLSNNNLVHCLLLQILYLIRSSQENNPDKWQVLIANILEIQNLFTGKILVIDNVYIDILNEIILKQKSTINNFNDQQLNIDDHSKLIGLSNYTSSTVLLKIINSDKIPQLPKQPFDKQSPDVIEVYLNIAILIIFYDDRQNYLEKFDFKRNEIKFVETFLMEYQRKKIRSDFVNNMEFGQSLVKIVKGNNCNFFLAIKALLVISSNLCFIKMYLMKPQHEKFENSDLLKLFDQTKIENEYITIALYKMIEQIFNELNCKRNVNDLDLLFLHTGIQPENHDDLRKISARIICEILDSPNIELTLENDILLSRMVLALLRDDNDLIRKVISTQVIRRPGSIPYRSLHAQKLYLKLVRQNYVKKYGPNISLIIFMVLASYEVFDETDDDGDNDVDETIRCFDRNESNVFREKFETIWQIFQTIAADVKDANIEQILKECEIILNSNDFKMITGLIKKCDFYNCNIKDWLK